MRNLSIILALSLLFGAGYAQSKQTKSPTAKAGMVYVTFEVSGTYGGYQLLLDPTHSKIEAGFTFPACNAIPADIYDDFTYKIPEDADPSCTALNFVKDNSVTIQVPVGTYDLFVIMPGSYGMTVYPSHYYYRQTFEDGKQESLSPNDYAFEAGKMYKFVIGSDNYVNAFITAEPDAESPLAVSNLMFTAGSEGALKANLSWINPSKDFAGSNLAELTAIKIYENDGEEPVHTISNPEMGEADSYEATVSEAGNYIYKVVAENAHGTASASTKQLWIGIDLPKAPENVTLVKSGDTAKLSWEAPTESMNGGYINTSEIVYDVYRNENTLVAEDLGVLSFREIFTYPIGEVSYKVVAKNSSGEGGDASSYSEVFCMAVSTFPWEETFDAVAYLSSTCWETSAFGANAYIGWNLSNTDGRDGTAGVGHPADYYGGMYGRVEDVLISPAIAIPETGKYKLSFWSKSSNTTNEAHRGVWISTTNTDKNSFTELRTLQTNEVTSDWTQIEQDLDAYAGQTIYLAFKYNDSAYNEMWSMDDISITEIPEIAHPATNAVAVLSQDETQAIITWEAPNSTKNATKSLEKYEIYRLTEEQPEPWTKLDETNELTYTDNGWATLAEGTYQYAVKVVYTNDNVSTAAMTNTLTKITEVKATIILTTNSGDDVNGTTLTLTHHDGNSEHIYTATASNDTVIFPKVWKGTYDISATLAGFEPYTSDAAGVEITADKVIAITLEEIIETPFSLKIEETDTDGERMFSWNNAESISDNKPSTKSLIGYTVYLDGAEKADNLTETEYLFTNLENGDYVAGVKAVYSSGESELKTINFTVTEIAAIGNLLPNPEIEIYSVKNEVFVNNPNHIRLNTIQIFDLTGHLIYETKSTTSTSFTLNVPTGHYFVRLIPETGQLSATKIYLMK